MSKKITELTLVSALVDADWITGIDVSQADPALQNIKITKANLFSGYALQSAVDTVQSNLNTHTSTNAKTAHPDGINQTDLTNHKSGINQHSIAGVTGLQSALDLKVDASALGDAAYLNVGTLAGDVAAGDAPANAITAHEAAYNHARIPTAAQKDALDNNATLSSANPVASQNDIVDEGIALKSTGQAADRILVTDGLAGFIYEDKPTGGGGSDHNLEDHLDVSAYAGNQGKILKVNATENGTIWGDPSGTTVAWGDITGASVYDQTDLGDELNLKLEDAASDGNTYSRRDGSWVLNPVTPIGGLTTSYNFESDTTATSPASGGLKVNNANQLLATQLYVHETSAKGNNADEVWGNLQAGDYVGIWEEQSDYEGLYYEVTGAPVDQTGWWSVPVSAVPGSVASIENAQPIRAFTVLDPPNKLPLGGTTGQVLAKASNADFALSWQTPASGGVTNPLTADLDVGTFSIISGDTANQDIVLAPDGTGVVIADGGDGISDAITFRLKGGSAATNYLWSTNLLIIGTNAGHNILMRPENGANTFEFHGDHCSSNVPIHPGGANAYDLGQTGLRWRALYADDAIITNNVTVADEVYDATAWNGSLEVPTKNAIRDKIESMGAGGWVDGTVVQDWGLTEATEGGSGAAFTWDLDNGHIAEITLTQDATITLSSTAAHANTEAKLILNTAGFTPTFAWTGKTVHWPDGGFDWTTDGTYLVAITQKGTDVYVTEQLMVSV